MQFLGERLRSYHLVFDGIFQHFCNRTQKKLPAFAVLHVDMSVLPSAHKIRNLQSFFSAVSFSSSYGIWLRELQTSLLKLGYFSCAAIEVEGSGRSQTTAPVVILTEGVLTETTE